MTDEKNLEQRLKSALPPQKAPEELRMKLRQELMRQPQTRRKHSGLPLGIASIAAVLVLGLVLWPTLFPNLPTLPSIASTGPVTRGASGGPGFELKLVYTKAGQLAELPVKVDAVFYPPVPFSPQAVTEAAARLGVSGEVVTEPWQDGQTHRIDGPSGETVIIFPSGFYNYHRPTPAEFEADAFPSKAELVDAAKGFLSRLGIDPVSAQLGEIKVPETVDFDTAEIYFTPTYITNQVSISPYARVLVGPDKEIYGAGWVWPAGDQEVNTYSTRSIAAAWQDVQAGKGKLVVDYHAITGPVAGTVINGTAQVTEASIAYILTYGPDAGVVLQPVAAFTGEATLEDGSKVPFTVYTEAVQERYYQPK